MYKPTDIEKKNVLDVYDNISDEFNNTRRSVWEAVKELLDYSGDDPFGIDNQIRNFMTGKVDYPIILLKYPVDNYSIEQLEKILCKKVEYILKDRKTKTSTLDKDVRDRLISVYKPTADIVCNSPNIIIRYPDSDYTLSQKDVIKYEVKTEGLPGSRIKHFIRKGDLEFYNERDISGPKYGGLRIKKPHGWFLRDFKELSKIYRGHDYSCIFRSC